MTVRANYQCTTECSGSGHVSLRGEIDGVSDSVSWSGSGRSYELLLNLNAIPPSLILDVTGRAEANSVFVGNDFKLNASLNFCLMTVVWGRNKFAGSESTKIDLHRLDLTMSAANDLASGTVNYLAVGN